ncbi:rCG32162, isoform CRA_c, partial [Rattus norvegicus]
MTHWGSGPFPTSYPPSSWLRGCCRDTAGAERPADRWASGAGPLQVHPQALKEWLPPGVLCSSPWSGRRGPRRRGRPGAEFDGDSAYVGMSDGNPELLSTSQTYNSQGESNEDYEIPPITPPNLPEPSLLHLGDHEAGYHSLCHGLAPNGLLPAYSYQAMDLPAIMVSNMLAQDGHLLSGQLPTV